MKPVVREDGAEFESVCAAAKVAGTDQGTMNKAVKNGWRVKGQHYYLKSNVQSS